MFELCHVRDSTASSAAPGSEAAEGRPCMRRSSATPQQARRSAWRSAAARRAAGRISASCGCSRREGIVPGRHRRLLDRRRRRRLLCGRQARRARGLRPLADQAPGHGAARFPHQRLGPDRRRAGCSRLLEHDLADLRIETLPIRFCTIATELVTGHEIWLTRGPLVQAMRASYALPGRVRSGHARRPLADGRRARQPDPDHRGPRARRRRRHLRQPQRRGPRPRHGDPVPRRRAERPTRSRSRRRMDEPRRWGIFAPPRGRPSRRSRKTHPASRP